MLFSQMDYLINDLMDEIYHFLMDEEQVLAEIRSLPETDEQR